MQYDQQLLTDAEEFAGMLLSDQLLAHVLELSLDEIRVAVANDSNALGRAIRKGRARTIAEHHKAQIDLATRGSAIAQQQVSKLIQKL